jgi:hypothetical protein
VPPEYLPQDEERRAAIFKDFEGPFGDRKQEIVVIGIDMDEGAIRAGFDRCLLTDEELALGPDGWAKLPDPFPSWDAPVEAGTGASQAQ